MFAVLDLLVRILIYLSPIYKWVEMKIDEKIVCHRFRGIMERARLGGGHSGWIWKQNNQFFAIPVSYQQ